MNLIKHIRVLALLLLAPAFLFAQENINVTAPNLVPAPLDFRSNGTLSFIIQNVNLPGYPADSGVEILIEMEKIRPLDGVASLYGVGSTDFEWTYDEEKNELRGLQIADIGFLYSASINVDFRVTEESPANFDLNGFVVTASGMPFDGNPDDNITSAYTSTTVFRDGVSGSVFYDANQNKIQDEYEYGVQGINVNINPANAVSLTNRNGIFFKKGEEGQTYTMSVDLGDDWILTSDESTLTHTYTTGDPDNSQNNFGIYPVEENSEIYLDLASNPTKCNTVVFYQMRYQNLGTDIINGTLNMSKDAQIEYVSASGNVTINNDEFSWPIVDLYPNETIDIYMNFRMPDENSIGDTISMAYNLTQDDSGNEVVLFEDVYESILLCAFDPNDKLVFPQDDGIETFTEKDENLIYTVRFENLGNASAKDVLILDELDANLNLSTFRVLNSSHYLRTSIDEREVSFLFDNIYLEPTGQGYVTYSIQPNSDLANFTQIQNTAEIIFDSNFPIVTNTTVNTLCDETCVVSTEEILENVQVNIFPNPTEGEFTLDSKYKINDVEIYSVSGQRVYITRALNMEGQPMTIHPTLMPGAYWVKMYLENGVVNKKLIVQ